MSWLLVGGIVIDANNVLATCLLEYRASLQSSFPSAFKSPTDSAEEPYLLMRMPFHAIRLNSSAVTSRITRAGIPAATLLSGTS